VIFLICFIRGYLSIMTKVEGLTSSLELTWIFFVTFCFFFFQIQPSTLVWLGIEKLDFVIFFYLLFISLFSLIIWIVGLTTDSGWLRFFFQIFSLTLGWGELGFNFFFNLLYMRLSYFHNYDCKFWRLFRVDLGRFFFKSIFLSSFVLQHFINLKLGFIICFNLFSMRLSLSHDVDREFDKLS